MINRDSILDCMHKESYKPLSYHELKAVFGIKDVDEDIKFSKIVGKLEKEGEIVKTRAGKFGLPEMMNLVKGIIHISKKGFGVLVPDKAGLGEVFVYGKKLNGAMHNDRVMVRIQEKGYNGQRPEGTVIRILARNTRELVGTFTKGRHLLQVVPDDSRQIYPIYVKASRKWKAKEGDKVLVRISSWPERDKVAEGKIVEVLGRKGEAGVDLKVLAKKHGLRLEFPDNVMEEARNVAVEVNAEEISRRRDLREWRMVTIDGEDAKDLDDAVSIEKTSKGYKLGVHIADVSHYVKEDCKLDREAFKRGTSVYLIDKVLPMLPVELSNNICSLNPQVERLAISCIMDIDSWGQVVDYEIVKSVIQINERMTYSDVNRILADNPPALKERYGELVEDFFLMKELSDILRRSRLNRGMLDFDFPESKVIVDEEGFPLEVKRAERGPGEMLIEDFMIKANEVVAEHLHNLGLPVLYRVHEKPDEEAISELNKVLAVFGHKIKGHKVSPMLFQGILADIKGQPEEQMISLMILRSMKHASYLPEPRGHFGLASPYYCHFTSPIRRYPDLIVHRVLSSLLDGGMTTRKKSSLEKKMTIYGEQSSLQEMKAEEAERELLDVKKAQYMSQFVGDEFSARISSVQAFGFFVALENTVEGLVHISSIADDYYLFSDRTYTLRGRHSGRKFAIGDQVRVQLVRVDVDEGKIDFELLQDE
ncbi:ribonuclease R [Syntrophomonas wolfei]|uniref:Ribonuclease R n=1 Tax=Syntrophomonas wolfei subsp. wolfei (strain DSM 2245B / Goettingen) TaxID=335541 RepID=Q0B076_SYNWW|nr:ribonuclease R [Syntrophomonas wolfei]ABI67628.1 RNAse R [Syntrophomonas wolfei subsp. wolfei str. Goettingen G311]